MKSIKELNGKCIYSNDFRDYTYDYYVEFCEINDMEPADDGSQEYYDWVYDMINSDYDDFIDNLEFSWTENRMWVICGSCGLWNGRHEIIPEMFMGLSNAVKKILNVNYDNITRFTYDNGVIHVSQSHHDGFHSFEIRLVRKNFENAVNRFCYDEGFYDDMKMGWFQNVKDYLY